VGTKQYLGDGVYVARDGYQLQLTAENGVGVTNEIFLEAEVWQALVIYVNRLQKLTRRPANFSELSPEEQWAVDKQLGILDV
jgi:hypothetical protein